MALDTSQDPARTAAPRDLDLESVLVGPATRMLVLETDEKGALAYQFGKRQSHILSLPQAFARRPWALMDIVRAATLQHPRTNRLEALASFTSIGNRIFLFGENWGKWLDENGRLHPVADMALLLRQWQVPVALHEEKRLLSFTFQINIYHREIFTRELLYCCREGHVRHHLELFFSYPSGEFRHAQLQIEDIATCRSKYVFDLDHFPLVWPAAVAAPGRAPGATRPHLKNEQPPLKIPSTVTPTPAGEQAPPTAAQQPKPQPTPPAGHRPNREQPHPSKAPATPAPAKPRPLPRTEALPTQELVEMLSTEHDPERRWKIIEANLILGRPERTYPLILHYADLIAERVQSWAPIRLRTTFAQQPGAVLIGLMHRWHVNQVLAVAEENAEADRILAWLREREIERLLRLNLGREPVSVEEARHALQLDRHADETMIKKTWRTLLGFMNADHGRSEERAIHRKKDEIAKHLQVARNILLKAK